MLYSFLKYSSLSPNSVHGKTPTNFSWSRNTFSFSSAKSNFVKKTGKRVDRVFCSQVSNKDNHVFSHCLYKFCLEDNNEYL